MEYICASVRTWNWEGDRREKGCGRVGKTGAEGLRAVHGSAGPGHRCGGG